MYGIVISYGYVFIFFLIDEIADIYIYICISIYIYIYLHHPIQNRAVGARQNWKSMR